MKAGMKDRIPDLQARKKRASVLRIGMARNRLSVFLAAWLQVALLRAGS
jgi:hypothetical protein